MLHLSIIVLLFLLLSTYPIYADAGQDLIAATNSEDIATVQALLNNGIDIEQKDEHGDTALGYAAESGQKNIVELLLKKGAAVNSKNHCGNTPLSFAIREGHADMPDY
jgi:ankyrin repeat protein